jgi:hypothetical protein
MQKKWTTYGFWFGIVVGVLYFFAVFGAAALGAY